MRRYKEQLQVWIECWRLEIRAAVVIGQALLGSPNVVEHDGTSVRADFFGPVGPVDEWLRDQQFSRLTIERVEESVPVRDHNYFSRLAGDRQVRLNRHVCRVPIVDIVGSELVVPA